jgi:hypothetical protein
MGEVKVIKFAFAFFGVWFVVPSAQADGQKTLHYQGTARIINLDDGSQTGEQVLLKKIYDPHASILSEIACYKGAGKASAILPVYMKISGNTMQISDKSDFAPGKLSGAGNLQGSAGDWTFLKWSMEYQTQNGVATVEDVNFVVGNQLIGRKQMFFKGHPFQLWDIEMTGISQTEFEVQAKLMGCPTF